jgi:16S rRNA (cytosine967-C5)-methyltransferase
MRDLPRRAAKAGVTFTPLATAELEQQAPFDLVLCDVPCSGSGAWRRAPDDKWRLTPERLEALIETQAGILDAAAALVRPGGWLGYATCSILAAENRDQIAQFRRRHAGWSLDRQKMWLPDEGTDGFYSGVLTRA